MQREQQQQQFLRIHRSLCQEGMNPNEAAAKAIKLVMMGCRSDAIVRIQSVFRGWKCRRRFEVTKTKVMMKRNYERRLNNWIKKKPQVMTILGPVDREKLGITAFREHLFSRLPKHVSSSSKPITLSNLSSVRSDPRCTVHNLHLNAETAVDELRCFEMSGGQTMVETTPVGHFPDVVSLRKLAQTKKKEVHIIRGSGIGSLFEDESPVEQHDCNTITQRLVRDLTTEGAGIIGEIVLSSNRSICDIRCLSSAKAHFASGGAPILIIPSSPYNMDQIEYAISILTEHQVPSSSIVVAGVYAYLQSSGGAAERIERDILSRGVNLCIDIVGFERIVSRHFISEPLPSEEEMARVFCRFIRNGFASQILFGHGTLYVTQTRKGGEHGASRLLKSFVRVVSLSTHTHTHTHRYYV